jgi:thymidylate kinase
MDGHQDHGKNGADRAERTGPVTRSITGFFAALQGAAERAGCLVQASGNQFVLQECGAAELSLLISELRQLGYTLVQSRHDRAGTRLGVQAVSESTPTFFEVVMTNSSVRLPQTKGLFLAFLGPDGVGKTTTIVRVMESLKPIFQEQLLFHWRPQMLKPRTAEDEACREENWLSINRHGDPPRGLILSLLRLGGVFADYFVGQVRAIAPALNRGALVVFDRYYHDILVDSRRYRYGGPQWLLPLVKHALPQRKALFVVLDAEENVILSRKQEVSPEELRAQRRKYSRLARTLNNCVHVRTDDGVEPATNQVLRGIGNYLAHSFDEQLLRNGQAVMSDSHPEIAPVSKTA